MDTLEQLKTRYFKARDYFNTKFASDTEQNRQKALSAYHELEKLIEETWQKAKYKTLEFSEGIAVDEAVEAAKEPFYTIKGVDCYTRSRRIVIRLELPEFWKYAEVHDES